MRRSRSQTLSPFGVVLSVLTMTACFNSARTLAADSAPAPQAGAQAAPAAPAAPAPSAPAAAAPAPAADAPAASAAGTGTGTEGSSDKPKRRSIYGGLSIVKDSVIINENKQQGQPGQQGMMPGMMPGMVPGMMMPGMMPGMMMPGMMQGQSPAPPASFNPIYQVQPGTIPVINTGH